MTIKSKAVVLLIISLLLTGLIVGGSGLFVLYKNTFSSTQVNMNGQAVQLAGEIHDLFNSFAKGGLTKSKQHFLYFFPLPQEHGSLRPILGSDRVIGS